MSPASSIYAEAQEIVRAGSKPRVSPVSNRNFLEPLQVNGRHPDESPPNTSRSAGSLKREDVSFARRSSDPVLPMKAAMAGGSYGQPSPPQLSYEFPLWRRAQANATPSPDAEAMAEANNPEASYPSELTREQPDDLTTTVALERQRQQLERENKELMYEERRPRAEARRGSKESRRAHSASRSRSGRNKSGKDKNRRRRKKNHDTKHEPDWHSVDVSSRSTRKRKGGQSKMRLYRLISENRSYSSEELLSEDRKRQQHKRKHRGRRRGRPSSAVTNEEKRLNQVMHLPSNEKGGYAMRQPDCDRSSDSTLPGDDAHDSSSDILDTDVVSDDRTYKIYDATPGVPLTAPTSTVLAVDTKRIRVPSSPSRSSSSDISSKSPHHEVGRNLLEKVLTPRSSSKVKDSSNGVRTPRVSSPKRPCSRWKLGPLLGEGSFGQVYKGLNLNSGDLFAVKSIRIQHDGSGTNQAVAQLVREISLLKGLKHKNIVAYRGTEQREGFLYIFLEYIAGGSVSQLLKEFGAFPEPLTRGFAAQILSGVSYLHCNHIMHRDIKGANILVARGGVVKLADFGCSKQLQGMVTDYLDNSMQKLRGSVPWMAPEVIKQSGHGRKADIWSVGATIIEMTTAQRPWPKLENGVQALFHIASAGCGPPAPKHISKSCKAFLDRCFHVDPKFRSSAPDLLEDKWIRDGPRSR